jgi:MYXO-CTERM domain-containing protein
MSRRSIVSVASVLVAAVSTISVASGQVTAPIDGIKSPGEYPLPALHTQLNPTGFGDLKTQLDAMYVKTQANGGVQMLFTGNLEGNYNAMLVWLDNGRPGATSLGNQPDRSIGSIAGERTYSWGTRDGAVLGSIFADGFDPARVIFMRGNNNVDRGPQNTYYTNYIDTSRPSSEFLASDRFLGGNPWITRNNEDTGYTGTASTATHNYNYQHFGIDYTGDITYSFDSSNALTWAAGSPTLNNTGFEIRLDPGPFGLKPGETAKVMAILSNGTGTHGDIFHSNQTFPSLPNGTGNIGNLGSNNGRTFDQNNWPTVTFIELPTPTVTGSVTWGNDADWSTLISPNGRNTQARILGSAASTITVVSSTQIGTLYLDNAFGVTIQTSSSGGSDLRMAAIPGDTTVIRSSAGAHAINVPLILESPVSVELSGGASLNVPNNIRSVVDASPARGLAVSGGGDVTTPIYTGGPVFAVGTSSLLLSIGGVISGQSEADVRALVLPGGIGEADPVPFSALGVRANQIDNNGLAEYGTFLGVAVVASDILVLQTWAGDTNLDGVLDATDFNNVLNGYTNALTGWANGDLNYDNVVDLLDWAQFLGAYGAVAGVPFGNSGPGASIPEPAALGLLALALPALSRRRR